MITIQTYAQVWQLGRKTPLQLFTGHRDWLRAIALSSDGTRAIVGGYDATLGIYDVTKGEVRSTGKRNKKAQNRGKATKWRGDVDEKQRKVAQNEGKVVFVYVDNRIRIDKR